MKQLMKPWIVWHWLRASFAVVLLASFSNADDTKSKPISFINDVASILLDHCVACHGPKKAEGGYRLDNFDEMLKPGDSGASPVATGLSGELIRRITCVDTAERMPAETDALAAGQVEVLKRWLTEGAKFDGEKSDLTLNLVIPPRTFPDPPSAYPLPVQIAAMAFSPDGSMLLVGGYHEITVWSISDAKLSRRIKNVGQRVFSIVFLTDKKTIAVGCGEPGKNGEVRFVDFESGEVKGVVARCNDAVLDIAIRPSTEDLAVQELAIASADGLIRIVDAQKMAELRTISSHADWVTAVAWSADGTRLASASRDKSAKVFVANTGELLSSYAGHAAAVRGVAFLPGGKQVYSTGADKKLHRWEVDGPKKVMELSLGGEAFRIVGGENVYFVPSADNQLRRIDSVSNKATHSLDGYQDWVLSTALHLGSNRVAGGSMNGEVRLWNATDGTLIHHWVAKP